MKRKAFWGAEVIATSYYLQEATKEMERDFGQGHVVMGQMGMALN